MNETWYVLRGDEQHGPYEYSDMIHMMQKNLLVDSSYVWAPHLEQWTVMGDLVEFSRDRIARLKEKNELKESFVQRQSARREVSIPVYGHNGEIFFDGTTLSLSVNGALMLLNSPLLFPGHKITLHFRGVGTLPEPLLVRAEVLRKNFTRGRLSVKSGLQYAVRFVDLDAATVLELQKTVRPTNAKEAQ